MAPSSLMLREATGTSTSGNCRDAVVSKEETRSESVSGSRAPSSKKVLGAALNWGARKRSVES
jgi:hypothetical protein